MAIRIRYNAPITLTFSIFCTLLLLIDQYLGTNWILRYFIVGGRDSFPNGLFAGDKSQYYQLFSHIAGHRDWGHLSNNLAYILLLGPILEERYGSFKLVCMILFTALINGLININFYDVSVMGASGIVFMMITLISIVNIRRNEIPLTLILMFFLFLAKELFGLFSNDGVSQISHISGGVLGIFLGFSVQSSKKWRIPPSESESLSKR